MVDLKVLVDGVERVVRGVGDETSCESVLIALANATGKSGKLALVEKTRHTERILPPEGKPISYLHKWQEQNGEVQFILRDDSTVGKSDGLSFDEKYSGKNDESSESSKRNSLENRLSSQKVKIERLTRQLDVVNLQLECASHNEEDYLYFTEEEIGRDRAKKLRRVLDLQSRDLSGWKAWESELAKQKQLSEKLTLELDSHKQKVRLMEVHVSDLEEVGRKLASSIASSRPDSKDTLDNDLSDLEQEMTIAKEELGKQKLLGDRQAKEREKISQSFTELDSRIQEKHGELESLGKDLSPGISYYDLDEGMKQADLTNDSSSTEESDNSEELTCERRTNTNAARALVPPFRNNTRHTKRMNNRASRSCANRGGTFQADDQGIYV